MRKIVFHIVAVLVFIVPLSWAVAGVISDGNKPIRIVSDRFDVYSDKSVAIFSGNVEVTQEDTVITSDKFYLHYKKTEGNKAGEKHETVSSSKINSGNLQKIEAKGHVVIRQKGKVVTGETAVFFSNEQKIVVTGNPVMKEGVNSIRGDTIIFFLSENRGIVESSLKRRVTATIYPEEKTD